MYMCKVCGHSGSWRNQRGNRLADMRCVLCGSEVASAVWHDGKYVLRSSLNAGPKVKTRKVACAVCGRFRRVPGNQVFQVADATEHRVHFGSWLNRQSASITIPAGSYCCWYHRSEVDNHTASNIHDSFARYLGVMA